MIIFNWISISQFSLDIVEDYAMYRQAKESNNDQKVKSLIKIAIQNNKYLKIHYTNSTFGVPLENFDTLTNIRTISNVSRSLDILDNEHVNRYNLKDVQITAFCNLRTDKRTFDFNRINRIEVLNM